MAEAAAAADEAWTNIIDETINVTVDSLYHLIFDDDSRFFKDFVKGRNITDLVISNWQNSDTDDSENQRVLTYTVHPNQMFVPADIPSTETQISCQISTDEFEKQFIINSKTTTMGHRYADSFHVLIRYELSKISADQCRMVVKARIIFTQAVMVTGTITSATLDDLLNYFTCLATGCKQKLINQNRAVPLQRPRHRITEPFYQSLLRKAWFKIFIRAISIWIIAWLSHRLVYP
ncbi:hypothetical protein SNE40_017311 [Patella caerulea]|uniref:VASt domain-containing protein n=1 Tax=Patella caerulea TaxID=87958 RepID=A0AAN8JET5_PATCE